MELQCNRESASYDDRSEMVRFSGRYGDSDLAFAVTRLALEELVGRELSDPGQILRSFNDHYALIATRAADLWQAVKTENDRRGTTPSTVDPHVLASLK